MTNTRTKVVSTTAFQQEAVRLVTTQGLSRAQVARDLGISADTIGRWMRAHAPVSTPIAPPVATPTAADLARLRRANDQLRMERDILKKARGICSQLPQCAPASSLWPTMHVTIPSRWCAGYWGWPAVAFTPGNAARPVPMPSAIGR
jgi:transposase